MRLQATAALQRARTLEGRQRRLCATSGCDREEEADGRCARCLAELLAAARGHYRELRQQLGYRLAVHAEALQLLEANDVDGAARALRAAEH